MAYPIYTRNNYGRRTMIVPPTTDMALVFPFDHENKRFDKSFYSHFLTDGRASSDQIEQFLKDAEEAFKQKLKWIRAFKLYLIFSFVIGFLLMSMYSMTVVTGFDDDSYDMDYNASYQSSHNHKKSFRHQNRSHDYDLEEQIDVMFMGWIFLIFAAAIWGAVYKCLKNFSIKKARKGVQGVIDRHSPMFASLGLRWNLPLAFPHYIELWKDYKGQNFTAPSSQFSCYHNPLNFHQIQNQLQYQNQRYPNLPTNQVIDQRATYLDFQSNNVASPLLTYPGQRRDENNYVPPHASHFTNNTQ